MSQNPSYPPPGYPQQPQPQQGYPQQQQGYPPPAPQPGVPQGYPQQPGYPQQSQPPPQPGYPQPQSAPPPAAVPPPPAAPPPVNMPDEHATKAGFDDAGRGGYSDGPRERRLQILGPQGETKWENVPVGFRNHVDSYLAQPRESGGAWFVKQVYHFWKSSRFPNGRIMNCGEGCLFCPAAQAGQNHPDPGVAKRSSQFGRRKTNYLYNALALDFPAAHMYEDQVMRPFILSAGKRLQKAIGNLVDVRGGVRVFCNHESFRPIRITKHKSGQEARDVEYAALDLDPRPLDPMFWHALANLWVLEELAAPASREDYEFAIADAGLIMQHTQVQVPMQYPGPYGGTAAPPAAPPPAASPYGQPAPMAGPAYAAPASSTDFAFGANAPQHPAAAYPPPPAAPPMASSYQQPAPPPAVAPPLPPVAVAPPPPPPTAAPPPPMPSAPPVQSAPAATTPYAPTTGQAPPAAAPPPPPPVAAAPPPPPPPPPAAAQPAPPPVAAAPPPPPPPPPAPVAQQTLEGLQGQIAGEGQK